MPATRPLLGLRAIAALAVVLAMVSTACTGSDEDTSSTSSTQPDVARSSTTTTAPSSPPPDTIVLVAAATGGLEAWAGQPEPDGTFRHQQVLLGRSEDVEQGHAVGGQICAHRPDGDDAVQLVARDSGGPPAQGATWGVLRMVGDRVGSLAVTAEGRLETQPRPSADPPTAYGCAFLEDGRLLTTDVGARTTGPGTGQLTLWFPPLDGPVVASCKLATALATPLSVLVVNDAVAGERALVATARGGVVQVSGPFPSSADPAGGCSGRDATGAPAVELATVPWLAADGVEAMAAPAGLAPAPAGGVYVSSVSTGVVNEYGPDATFRRNVLAPPSGESVERATLSSGTPMGLATDAVGNLYLADVGLGPGAAGLEPVPLAGGLWRMAFRAGEPTAPRAMATGRTALDGVGVVSAATGGGGGLLVP